MNLPSCQHGKTILEGCLDCYHNVESRAIHDDLCEIIRAIFGATKSTKAGRPRFQSVEKDREDLISSCEEIEMILSEIRNQIEDLSDTEPEDG